MVQKRAPKTAKTDILKAALTLPKRDKGTTNDQDTINFKS